MQGASNGSMSLSILRLVACMVWMRASNKRVELTQSQFSQPTIQSVGKEEPNGLFIGDLICCKEKLLL